MMPLKAPAGLDIQARRGDEIALSIMAEIVQRRRNAELLDLTLFKESVEAEESPKSTPSVSKSQPETAVDPICGMEVDIASAKFTHEHEGATYYFCCAGCQTKFSQDPEQYLTSEAPSGEAIDPVCNMTVEIASAEYMSEYEDQLIYFCGPGCMEAFDADPAVYISLEKSSWNIEQTVVTKKHEAK
jgi:YHS domain-containing protein